MLQGSKVIFSILFMFSSLGGICQNATDTAKEGQKTIYLFSGIGADSSVFMNLKLPGYHKVYITWIPALPNETLTQYAGRIRSQITVENPYFIGLSFGGIIAVEVSKLVRVEKMVLISSVRTKSELNKFQFFFMKLGLYRIIPGPMIKRANFLSYRYFGVRSENDKKALTKLLKDTDVTFFRWALKGIAYWDNKEVPERTIQIHGTADRVITSRLVHPDYRIKGGGHLMVLDKADTISKIIMNYFRS
jgi:pimeloyl-ACP methyl ester carboxylesterase